MGGCLSLKWLRIFNGFLQKKFLVSFHHVYSVSIDNKVYAPHMLWRH